MPGFFILLPPHLRPGSLVNRASDSGSEGRGFESHPGHKKSLVIARLLRIFCLCDFKVSYHLDTFLLYSFLFTLKTITACVK